MNHWDCRIGDSLGPRYFCPGRSPWVIAFDPSTLQPMRFERGAIGLPWFRVS